MSRRLTKIILFFAVILIFIEAIMFIGNYKLAVNISPSLPYRLFLVKTKNYKEIKNGDFIQFINKDAQYYNGVNITKQVLAIAGDVLEINIFKQPIDNIQGIIRYNKVELKVKDRTILGTKVHINNIPIIPENSYFVIGYNKDSFDSRYKEFGLISQDEIIGVAKPLF